MRDQINAIAERNERSANAEIVLRLQMSLSPTESPEMLMIRECFERELAKAVELILSKK